MPAGESGCRFPSVKASFAVVSRLGDGGVRYLLMPVLAVNGANTALVAAQMAMTSVVGTAPLDRYSFPSGHTLHAVCFTLLAIAHVPELAPCWPGPASRSGPRSS